MRLWRARLEQTHALGCRGVIVQWVGLNGSDEQAWSLPATLLDAIFGWAEELGLGVELGVPYDERWWQVLGSNNPDDLHRYLARAHASTQAYLGGAERWVRRPAFRGWYLPYEIEQYNWAARERQELLRSWLHSLTELALASSGVVPGVSTYFSQLPTEGDLAQLWAFILDGCRVCPMIQDGVGEGGLANYAVLEPLRRLLLRRAAEFDLVVELFERAPGSRAVDVPFRAQAASYGRLHAQLLAAQHYGARRVVAFAVDPWLIGPDAPGAARLLAQWRAVYGPRW